VTINGQKAVDQNGFSQAYEQAVRSGSLSLEVVREGALRTIRIALARI
jgi:type II secretory pathway component PulC